MNFGLVISNGEKQFYTKDHLGSTRAVINTQNTVISAQDYDPWGYIFDTRIYDNDNNKYKYTGKERDRDLENNYDYFGARYYDSRIGRWGGVEPLINRFISFSPYCYTLDNPILMIDAKGLAPTDVYLKGRKKERERAVEELNKESKKTGLKFSVDKRGKLSATGTPKDMSAEIINNAINDDNVTVNLYLTTKTNYTLDGKRYELKVGLYAGNKEVDGKVTTKQYINLNQADVWYDAKGSTVGVSIMHEIKESFIGAILFPGGTYENSFEQAHFLTESGSDPKGQHSPPVHYNPIDNYFYLENPKGVLIPFYEKK